MMESFTGHLSSTEMEPLQLFEGGEMGQSRIVQCLPLQMKVNFQKAMTLINTPPQLLDFGQLPVFLNG